VAPEHNPTTFAGRKVATALPLVHPLCGGVTAGHRCIAATGVKIKFFTPPPGGWFDNGSPKPLPQPSIGVPGQRPKAKNPFTW